MMLDATTEADYDTARKYLYYVVDGNNSGRGHSRVVASVFQVLPQQLARL
ncbi:hypothetical protein JG688_00007595 [Phytophthora aleatoria]|uniref:Uncharacterized protein n=1 Tax=Phytophthora aleatoria TaxID=2496075 RepID=A0A8J5J9I0_9STRA|nr:hypothetical protein JG688_00007595 [Phytophthora aleatoria]